MPRRSTDVDTAAHVRATGASPRAAAGRMPLPFRIAALIVILVPPASLVAAIVLVWGRGVQWLELALLIGMYAATGLGVTIGFHRYFAHRSFETHRPVQAILAVLGSMSVEGSLQRWVATHRCHHQHSDGADDPHSPHRHGGGLCNMARGLWRAHVGWIFEPLHEGLNRYVADLRADRLARTMSALFPVWIVLGLLVPGVLGGAVGGSWKAALLGVLWGGLVRIFFVHHVTWSVNSVCHIWGAQPFDTHDQSRNNAIFAVLGFGEGWHNNHHAFPTSARHGLRWWQLDLSYLIIRLMAWLGLAWNIRVPSSQRIAAKAR
jgi:stearoyl-CoA desaturase (delta-9 desaturase)